MGSGQASYRVRGLWGSEEIIILCRGKWAEPKAEGDRGSFWFKLRLIIQFYDKIYCDKTGAGGVCCLETLMPLQLITIDCSRISARMFSIFS